MEDKTLDQQIDDVLNDPTAKKNVVFYQFQQRSEKSPLANKLLR